MHPQRKCISQPPLLWVRIEVCAMMCIDKTIGDSVSGNIYIESFKNFGAEIITIFDMKAIDKKSCNHMNGSIWHPSCIRSILWTTTLLPIGCPISNIL